MKIIVNAHKCEIDKTPVNEKEINITKCEFEFAEEITNEFVKEAYFTLGKGETYKQIIVDNECDIPGEVLEKKGDVTIGVVAYLVENNTTIKRYNPSPAYFNTWEGSLKEATNTEPITPTDKEQIEQMLNNINVDANKTGKITTITITYKDGTTKDVTLEDGKSIEYNWQGTSLGIRQEGESSYEYVNLKGERGEAGAVKFIVVQELPTQDIQEDAMYLVPLETPETQDNRFAEYIYVNGNWELLGKISIKVDLSDYYTKQETYNKGEVDNLIPSLTDYVRNTDYATSSVGGVIRIAEYYATEVNSGYLGAKAKTYSQYQSAPINCFIGKGTLENVITGKDLTTKAYVDGLVGDIASAIDLINGESV